VQHVLFAGDTSKSHCEMNTYIPYKHTGGEELRYALRSIEKNLSGYKDVYLITEQWPEWYNGYFLAHPDVSNTKRYNIISKLHEVKDKRFIFWDDDHYLLKPLHVNNIKNWYEGDLSKALGEAHGKYHGAINNTLKAFGNIRYFDIHTPCVYDKEGIEKIFKLNWGDYIIKSIFFKDKEGEEMKDCKIDRPISREAIRERIKDRLFFSTGANGFKQQMKDFLNEQFPNKSRYEL
jgi:hypothetical protein